MAFGDLYAGDADGWTYMDELKFQDWYKQFAKKLNINPNPDEPKHYYPYNKELYRILAGNG